MAATGVYAQLDQWIDAHFDEQVRFLQELVRVPTDTPPGDNAAHAERARELLGAMGLAAEKYPVPAAAVAQAGLASITNLIVRRRFGAGPVIALNAHGDVVAPGEGWTHAPYGAEIDSGRLYGRGAAVSKSDFATFAFALRALEQCAASLHGTVELHFTYDEEFGGELGPAWLLAQQLTRPDIVIAAGFSYQVVNAHNGCLQIEVTVNGRMAHAAIPDTGIDALQGAVAILHRLYQDNARLKTIRSQVLGITHPYLNVGWIAGGTNTNVVPGSVVFKLDRRMIPEEDGASVERDLRALIGAAAASVPGVSVTLRRILMAHSLLPDARSAAVTAALKRHAEDRFECDIPVCGTPLYTDARLYAEAGAAAVLYGAGPRAILESNAKRADENIVLEDLRRATQVIARTLCDLLSATPAKAPE